ncbi:hypothetical protein [Paenibacillus aestuarii]|uniref:Uncharacterized protein n=1 Tax=Paenibacillus aestuarii TaxID=516965 RepID=A0ABW0K154_9BACL|nr:hypothetical protein [Paenibacillus aestuarii]
MAAAYDKSMTGVLLNDPYNDFLAWKASFTRVRKKCWRLSIPSNT